MAVVTDARRRGSRRTRGPVAKAGKQATASASAAASADVANLKYGPLDRYLGFYLRRLYDDYRKHFMTENRDIDLHPREAGALFVIGLNPGLTPSQLSAALALDAAQITAMLNMFEGRGILERRVSSSDARSRVVYLTAEGERMLKSVADIVENFDRVFSRNALTDDELELLLRLLAKLHAGIAS